jgi:hypothetical protein
MKTTKELIEEARELGVDIHDHVAQEMFGTTDVSARNRAKTLTFCYLYGGTGRTSSTRPNAQGIPIREPNAQNCKTPWTMTEEGGFEVRGVPMDEFKNLWMGEPYVPMTGRALKQSEDRMHRVGVVPYKVEVHDDHTGTHAVYTVHATSALDARCMAFVLDGGCDHRLNHWDDGHIELALAHTEIVE